MGYGFARSVMKPTTVEGLFLLTISTTSTARSLRRRVVEAPTEGVQLAGGQTPVRHIVLKLIEEGDTQQKKTTVVSVLPISPAEDADNPRGYRWVLAEERLPKFNRNLLGESAKLPGLGFDNVGPFDVWALQQVENESADVEEPVTELPEAFALWDEAFDVLSTLGAVDDEMGCAEPLATAARARYGALRMLNRNGRPRPGRRGQTHTPSLGCVLPARIKSYKQRGLYDGWISHQLTSAHAPHRPRRGRSLSARCWNYCYQTLRPTSRWSHGSLACATRCSNECGGHSTG